MALSLPEILDRIFIHLPSRLENSPRIEDDWRRDKTDLFSCSLVCREWKDEVRRHIFHTITYSFNCVHATVGHYWTIERALQKFIEFLRSSPDICRLVRRLNLICDMHAVDARVDWRDVYSIIELLQNVEWVMLHDVPLHSIILEPPALRFSISTLDLSGGHRSCFGEPSFVLAAVNMFTSIDTLRVSGLTISNDFTMAASAFPATRVAALAVDLYHNSTLLQCINPEHLRSLRLPSRSFGGSGASSYWWKALVRDGLGKQLEHLSFFFHEGGGEFLCLSIRRRVSN